MFILCLGPERIKASNTKQKRVILLEEWVLEFLLLILEEEWGLEFHLPHKRQVGSDRDLDQADSNLENVSKPEHSDLTQNSPAVEQQRKNCESILEEGWEPMSFISWAKFQIKNSCSLICSPYPHVTCLWPEDGIKWHSAVGGTSPTTWFAFQFYHLGKSPEVSVPQFPHYHRGLL